MNQNRKNSAEDAVRQEKDLKIKWADPEHPGMNIHGKWDLVWLSFPAFDAEPWIRNAFSTRFGGVSEGYFASMNLDKNRGDDPENVRENYRRMADAVGFDVKGLVLADQKHTTNVLRVGKKDRGAGYTKPVPWSEVDGLITDEPGVVLSTVYADCVPLYFIDPVHHAVGLSHSGWRGTAARMGEVTIRAMEDAFGSDPGEMKTAVGPCICRDCYEVSREVAEQFDSRFVTAGRDAEHFQLDLAGANREIMIEAGVPEEHISVSGLCTCCNPELLFSHRYTHGKRGEMAAFLEIRPFFD